MKTLNTDFLVVGSGITGLMSALHLSERGRVLVTTKRAVDDTNTNWAQGGIACVMTNEDSFEKHVEDTLSAGGGLCDKDVVEHIVRAAPENIAALEALGLEFSLRNGVAWEEYDLGKEGGHSKRRVLHSGDITGHAIQTVLQEHALKRREITLLENHMVIDLITTSWLEIDDENRCVGAYVLDRASGEIFAVQATCVVLATGGGGKVYLYTSNPDVATGDGIALGWRAGVPVKNMEFIQFHPTCLYHREAKSFLVSEAVRGEGAKLVHADGTSFTEKYDNRGALAPRDIVARAIDTEMKSSGTPCVYLDIRNKQVEFFHQRFPNIYAMCEKYGLRMESDLIPVVPAAHYFCGGLEAGVDGVTVVPGLFACGEVACTGLHGANRLASNSLLESLVCARSLVDRLGQMPSTSNLARPSIPDWEAGHAVPSDEAIVVEHNWNEVRTCMWDYVGIVRTDKRLERARRRVETLRHEIGEYYRDYLVMPDILELRNIADVAELIVRSAQSRKESRGLHYTLDYPLTNDIGLDTLIADEAGGTLSYSPVSA